MKNLLSSLLAEVEIKAFLFGEAGLKFCSAKDDLFPNPQFTILFLDHYKYLNPHLFSARSIFTS